MTRSDRKIKSSERIFRVPFLMLLSKDKYVQTSEILDILRNEFNPKGYDAKKIDNRNDDYFSQKIRNIKSHKSLDEYVDYDKNKGWILKESGVIFLSNISDVVEEIDTIINDFTFDYFDKITFIDLAILPFFPRRKVAKPSAKKQVKKVVLYDENVFEGIATTKTIQIRERSKKLRDKAVENFTNENGKIICSICGFEFGKEYGKYGEGYIEIHHKKPVYQYDDKDIDSIFSSALSNLTPVCSNCHRMLHHKKGITFDEVKKLYVEAQMIKNNK